MLELLAIALGGSVGAVSRYLMVGLFTDWLGQSFPYGTLAVNIIGSFFIGVMYIIVVQKFQAAPEVKAILMVGFLGAFTTFSTFSLETFNYINEGLLVKAMTYILSSVILCVVSVWAGVSAAKLLN